MVTSMAPEYLCLQMGSWRKSETENGKRIKTFGQDRTVTKSLIAIGMDSRQDGKTVLHLQNRALWLVESMPWDLLGDKRTSGKKETWIIFGNLRTASIRPWKSSPKSSIMFSVRSPNFIPCWIPVFFRHYFRNKKFFRDDFKCQDIWN